MPLGAWVPQIRASRFNAGEAFVVANDYRRGNMKPTVFRTTDFGKTWTNILEDKKVIGYALCVIQDPTQPNLIFVGTEQGLWISLDNAATFQQFKNDYPSVSTYDLAIQERENDLVIATFGRAIYILDDIGGLRKAAANMGKVFSNKVTVFNAPAGYQAHRKNAMGIEYSVWGTYEGENKKSGLPISFFVQKSASDTGKNAIGDTATLRFYDATNTLVRTIRTKTEAGFNRYFWGMEGRGLRASGGGGRGRMGGGAGFGGGAPQEAPGLPVDPGTYKVVVSAGRNFSDSTMLVVNDDPYAPTSKEVRDAIRKANARLDKTTEKLNTLNERMTEADGIIAKIEANLRDMDKKAADTIRKTVTVVKDEMKAIREMLNGKPQTKQGYGNIPQVTVSSVFGEARMTVMGKPVVPGAQEDRLITFAEQKVGEVITRANKFFDGTWKTLRALAEAAPVKIFKDYKTIE
jgi:hypothetical protein